MPLVSQLSLERDREYHCCLCLHVRTGTLLLGCLQLIIHIVALALMLTHIVNPNVFPHQLTPDLASNDHYFGTDFGIHMVNMVSTQNPIVISNDNKNLPENKPFAKGGIIYNIQKDPSVGVKMQSNSEFRSLREVNKKEDHSKMIQKQILNDDPINSNTPEKLSPEKIRARNDELWRICITSMSLCWICFMIYGALYYQPSYLLPYFAIQVFDFILACFKVMGIFAYLPEYKHVNDNNSAGLSINHIDNNNPYQNNYNNRHTASIGLVTVAFLVLAVKAYLMCMVWACYKYLVLQRRLSPGTLGASNFTETMRGVIQQVVTVWHTVGYRIVHQPNALLRIRIVRRQPADDTDDLINITTEEELPPIEPENENVQLPKYEELIQQPANANMPPPYFVSASDRTAIAEARKT